MKSFQCPNCGGNVDVRNPASLYVVCEFCQTTSIRKDMNLEEVGKVAQLKEDGSPLQLFTSGYYKGKEFTIIGRIQLEFPAGFWNEWHLDYNGESAWLGETNGTYVFTQKADSALIENLIDFKVAEVKDLMKIGDKDYFVKDIQEGVCVSGEGELPFSFESSYPAPVIDLVARDESFATIDYSEEEPILFLGDFVEFYDLKMQNLREVYGWDGPKS